MPQKCAREWHDLIHENDVLRRYIWKHAQQKDSEDGEDEEEEENEGNEESTTYTCFEWLEVAMALWVNDVNIIFMSDSAGAAALRSREGDEWNSLMSIELVIGNVCTPRIRAAQEIDEIKAGIRSLQDKGVMVWPNLWADGLAVRKAVTHTVIARAVLEAGGYGELPVIISSLDDGVEVLKSGRMVIKREFSCESRHVFLPH
ncbi:hypothetical protein Moror_5491 [Moniliophthora roreri MCA 2997]|uniref:Uncharacterized protein n=1 Tax=Moniliophthora roreri (strain MCA 2997) TaxID=1381753 RepID=V2X631_MONRO|nr:hypothetical protein Moror_5491 [Moniliophthora roreri MCA 2997]